MPRRSLLLALVLLTAAATAHAAGPRPPLAGKPNVLLLAIDDLNAWVSFVARATEGHLFETMFPDEPKRSALERMLTPNMDRLAAQGVAFSRAYCPSPLCGPSRTSFLSGLHPSSTLYYDHSLNFRDTVGNADRIVTLPEYLKGLGYLTVEAGKVFHKERGGDPSQLSNPQSDPRSWSVQHVAWIGTWWDFPPVGSGGTDYRGNVWKYAPDTTAADVAARGMKPGPAGAQLAYAERWHKGLITVPYFADYFYWGVLPGPGDLDFHPHNRNTFTSTHDYRQTDFTCAFLNPATAGKTGRFRINTAPGRAVYEAGLPELTEGQPFFFGLGLFLPHDPFIVPEEIDQALRKVITPDDIKVEALHGLNASLYQDPEHREGFKLSKTAGKLARFANIHEAMLEGGRQDFDDPFHYWREAIFYYLACVHFADTCVGRVLEALDQSPYRDHTIVVLLGDNGWHLGTKEHWSKMTVWEEGTHVPLIIKAPGVDPGVCREAVNLNDLYPTLVDLMDLPPPQEVHPRAQPLEGNSLKPLLKQPARPWAPASLSSYSREGLGVAYAAVDEGWRLVHYETDGAEELYNLGRDPREANNLLPLDGDSSADDRQAYQRLRGQLEPLMRKQGWWTSVENQLGGT